MTSHRSPLLVWLAAAPLLLPTAVLAAPPTADEVLERLLAAAGGQETFGAIGMLELRFDDEETKADGTTSTSNDRAFVSGPRLDYARVEMANNVVLGRSTESTWATIQGQLDDRPQTPMMASGTINQRLFPALVPFSLALPGVILGQPSDDRFEGAPAWRLDVTLPKGFFASPIMSGPWQLYLSKEDLSVLSLELRANPEYATVGAQGIRYRVLNTQKAGSCQLPSQILAEAIDTEGVPSGGFRTSRISVTAHKAWNPALFLDPKQLAIIDGDD